MSAPARTLGDMANALNRPAVIITSLQHRFELPSFSGAGYSHACLAFLRTLVSQVPLLPPPSNPFPRIL